MNQRTFEDVQAEAEKAEQEKQFTIDGNQVRIPWPAPWNKGDVIITNHGDHLEIYVPNGAAVIHTASNVFELWPYVGGPEIYKHQSEPTK